MGTNAVHPAGLGCVMMLVVRAPRLWSGEEGLRGSWDGQPVLATTWSYKKGKHSFLKNRIPNNTKMGSLPGPHHTLHGDKSSALRGGNSLLIFKGE